MTGAARAAARSDTGRQRNVNEDRVYADEARGIFIVVDGVGGQAAGGKAADTAIDVLRARLLRRSGSPADCVREAITQANNEIFYLASQRPEWRGMACVLTVVVLDGPRAVVGHVGDTRLYALHGDTIEKLTPDHSPVGEREDARELSEAEAMRHPRRNEVYRDVGSELHAVTDPDFIWLEQIPLAPGMSLLLCSDGLSDLLPSEAIRQIALASPGRPDQVVEQLVAEANAAGGRDNVSVVYIENAGANSGGNHKVPGKAVRAGASEAGSGRAAAAGWTVALILLVVLIVLIWQTGLFWRTGWPGAGGLAGIPHRDAGTVVVGPGQSIMAALSAAQPGDDVIVEPGEYRERVVLKDGVRVVSRVPRAATLRLPGDAAEVDAAVVAVGIASGELSGFRILGDAATPLGIGVLVRAPGVRLVDLEITGAATAAIDLGAGEGVALVGSDIHDNPGAALRLQSGATPRIAHTTFARNATAAPDAAAFGIDVAASATWTRNVFIDAEPSVLAGGDAAAQQRLAAENWFVASAKRPAQGRGSRSQ